MISPPSESKRRNDMENICKFIPPNQTAEHIQIINFVYETSKTVIDDSRPSPVYRIYFVTGGEGLVRCGDKEVTLKHGDIFFAFPAVCQSIRGNDGFRFLYISYIGIRASYEMERLGINRYNFAFENYEELYDLWTKSITFPPSVIDLAAESVLLHTLTHIGNRQQRQTEAEINENAVCAANAQLIKQFIDEQYANPNLSVEVIGKQFSYHKKYISSLFKKHFQMGIVEYVNTVRIHHACALMDTGQHAVSEIASLVGFRDALYFSRVFKQKVGISPTDYIKKGSQV